MEKETTCERFVYAYAKTERKVTELMESIKKNYSEEKWSQRMALINSGKCVNTESHENDKLFRNSVPRGGAEIRLTMRSLHKIGISTSASRDRQVLLIDT